MKMCPKVYASSRDQTGDPSLLKPMCIFTLHFHSKGFQLSVYRHAFNVKSVRKCFFFNPWTVNISLDDEAAAASDARVLSLIFQGEKKHNSSPHMLRSPQDSPGYSVCVCACVLTARDGWPLFTLPVSFFLDISCFFWGRSEEVVRPFSSSSSSSSEPSQQG